MATWQMTPVALETSGQNAPVVWVVIPTFNRCQVLLECLQSLSLQSYRRRQVVVVDDGSSDGTRTAVKDRFPDTVLLSGDGNRWWSGSMNLGLGHVMAHAAPHDFVLSCNDDVLLDAEFLSRLVDDARALARPCLIAARAASSTDPARIVFCGTRIDWKRGVWKGYPSPDASETTPRVSDSLPGRGTLIPLAAITRVGFYEDRSFPQYFGDEDFSLRAKAAGFELFVSSSATLLSHVEMTGTGRHGQTLSSFVSSLFSMRSPNQLSRRWRFIWRHCPAPFRLTFSLIDTVKVVTAFHRKRHMRA
jgi:GT2 family glycosyltransferase